MKNFLKRLWRGIVAMLIAGTLWLLALHFVFHWQSWTTKREELAND